MPTLNKNKGFACGCPTQIEIESKIRLPHAALLSRIPSLIRDLQGVCSAACVRFVTDTYCESPGFWFHHAGYACRIRRVRGTAGAEWTLKSLHRPQEGVASRIELTERLTTVPKLPSDRLPGRKLAGRIGRRIDQPRLIPLFTLIQRRRVFKVIWPETGLQVEVSLDVTRLAGQQAELAIVELELIQGTSADLKKVTSALRKRLGVRTVPPSKFAWAARLTGHSFSDIPPRERQSPEYLRKTRK